MLRPLPDMPWVSAFPELNVRTYVEFEGKPGVWFFSLDATNALAVEGGRRLFHLPYRRAEIALTGRSEDRIDYQLKRRGAPVAFAATYGPTGPTREAAPASLEHFLTERYCLYAQSPAGELLCADVHHVPWPLQDATADITSNTMASPLGLSLTGPPTHLHFARRVDVIVWPPKRVAQRV